MKTLFDLPNTLYTSLGFLLLVACGAPDPQTQLAELKKQHSELTEKIKTLEESLVASDSTSNQKTKAVLVSALTKAPFMHYVQVQGKLDAEESVNLSTKMGGEVTKIYVTEGQEVRAGQVLAETDNQVMIQGIAELKSQLDFANTVFEKQQKLWDQKIGSEIQYLSAKNNKDALEKKLSTLQEQSEMSKIKAPLSGVIDAVDIKVGQIIAPGMPSIRIVNLSKLKIKADVAEAYASKIKTGKNVTIFFPDLNKEVSGKISYAARVINPITRAFSVEIDLDNNEEYRANMIAVVKIVDYQNDAAIAIPVNILNTSESGQYVYVAEKASKGNIAKRVPVKTGSVYNGKTEILSGLNEGDLLITTGYQSLNEGEYITF